MFAVSREIVREDGEKVLFHVLVEQDKVTVTRSSASSGMLEKSVYTPLEADVLLDLLALQADHAGELNP